MPSASRCTCGPSTTRPRCTGCSAPAAVDKREYWGFSFYDWANSGYVTTVGTVLFAPYLTSVAETAACGYVGTADKPCHTNLHVLGLGVSPGSLAFYIVTV